MIYVTVQSALRKGLKGLMTGPVGNSEFCFPRPSVSVSVFPETNSRATLRFIIIAQLPARGIWRETVSCLEVR